MGDIPTTVATSAKVSMFARTLRTYMDASEDSFSATLTRGSVRLIKMFLLETCLSKGSARTHRGVRSTSYLTKLTFGSTSLKLGRNVTRRLNTGFRVPRKHTGTVLLPRVVRFGDSVGGRDGDRGRCLPTIGHCTAMTRVLKLDDCGRVVAIESLMG